MTGGTLRGRSLPVPAAARPTEGRVREALFSIWRDTVPGSRVLDLFAGSGVIAVEAVSRGALEAVAVERERRAVQRLQRSLRDLDLAGVVEVVAAEALMALATMEQRGERPFDLVFADPPYDFGRYEELLIAAAPLLAADGELVLEHSVRVPVPAEALDLVRTGVRRYGESALAFYRRLHPSP